MKKVIPILLALFIMLTSTCFATYEPDSNRWEIITRDSEFKFYLDKETIQYSEDGNIANIWLCETYVQAPFYWEENQEEYLLLNYRIDKNARTMTLLMFVSADAKTNKIIHRSQTSPSEEKAEIIFPHSTEEIIYKHIFSK